MTSLMQGKRGLIMGVANDRSLAWGIAKALGEQGAELGRAGEALVDRLCQRGQYYFVQAGRHVCVQARRRDGQRLEVEHLPHDLRRATAVGSDACQQLVGDHASCVEVCRRADILSEELLGGHVIGRAENLPAIGHVR
jgi:hypothetical protein